MEHRGQLDEYASHTAETIDAIDQTIIGEDVHLTIEQVIHEGESLVGNYHLVLADGSATVHPGPANSPDITITQDAATARAIRSGSLHAQGAFLTGRLSVDGDIDKLLQHGPLLSSLLGG